MKYGYRIGVVVALFAAAAAMPPPLALLLALFAAFFFPRLWETVAVGFFLDALYAAPEPRWFGFQYLYTVIALLALCAVAFFKKRMRFYTI